MFTRIGRFFKAIFNSVLGQGEAQVTVAMLEQSVREMMAALGKLKAATAAQMAMEAGAKRDYEANKAREKDLTTKAEEALKQGNEKLARRALQIQNELKPVLARSEQFYKVARERAKNAQTKFRIEQEKIEPKIRELGRLKSIHEMNKAMRQMQSINDNYNVDGANAVFDKVAASIEGETDKLAAMDTIAVSEGEELDRELTQISQKSEVDEALAALKAKLGETSTEVPAKVVDREKQTINSAFDYAEEGK